jgi:hypothetical protein
MPDSAKGPWLESANQGVGFLMLNLERDNEIAMYSSGPHLLSTLCYYHVLLLIMPIMMTSAVVTSRLTTVGAFNDRREAEKATEFISSLSPSLQNSGRCEPEVSTSRRGKEEGVKRSRFSEEQIIGMLKAEEDQKTIQGIGFPTKGGRREGRQDLPPSWRQPGNALRLAQEV